MKTNIGAVLAMLLVMPMALGNAADKKSDGWEYLKDVQGETWGDPSSEWVRS